MDGFVEDKAKAYQITAADVYKTGRSAPRQIKLFRKINLSGFDEDAFQYRNKKIYQADQFLTLSSEN